MDANEHRLREHAQSIFDAAVAAAEPRGLVRAALGGPLAEDLADARRVIVVGGGKAGSAMAQGLEDALAAHLERVEGIVNVPAGAERPLRAITAHPARPAGSNHPTADGVAGVERMLRLLSQAGPDDVAVCLLSGGGSALLPAPADGITLEDKQAVTKLLHASGATIDEMNAVRKHLSRVKGGGMVRAFRGRRLVSLIVSDVIGDPLDVIASGPTAADPTTFADALAVLTRYRLLDQAPPAVRQHLEAGKTGRVEETLKALPPNVENRVIGSNAISLRAAQARAEALGYRVVNLGAFVEGETRQVAVACAGVVRSIRSDGVPVAPPACLLLGGETTVTLGPNPGKGGRNQEFALAMLCKLGRPGLRGVVVLSAGTDGEDGPTDAAGAAVGAATWEALPAGADPVAVLDRHDAYTLFAQTGDLIRTGLTGTNVMDVRAVLIE